MYGITALLLYYIFSLPAAAANLLGFLICAQLFDVLRTKVAHTGGFGL
jgi:hypothetical protein